MSLRKSLYFINTWQIFKARASVRAGLSICSINTLKQMSCTSSFFGHRDLSCFKYKLWQFRWYFASRACNSEKFPATSLKGSASFFCLHCVLLLSTVSSLKNLTNRVSPHVLLIYKKDIKRYSLWLSTWFSTVSSLFQITKSFKCGETMGLQ